MKVLYAIQATGNGHISRANEIIPFLQHKCELDILVSGIEADVAVNYPIKYKLKGLSFIFGKKGGIDLWQTFLKLDTKRFVSEIRNLPVQEYDLVINDFEPISAWACKLKKVPCISMSHQFAVINKNAPVPKKTDLIGRFILNNYAPCKKGIGFHFDTYDYNIFTPVIRREIRNTLPKNLGHYTVYLPAYDEKKLVDFFSNFENVQWQIFSKRCKQGYFIKNCWVRPVDAADFTTSFVNCAGVVCGAGFETPAEALFMGKKLLVVPMKGQYEQHCNAVGAEKLGVPVISSIDNKKIPVIKEWLESKKIIQVSYEDKTDQITDIILGRNSDKSILETHTSFANVISKEDFTLHRN